MLGWWFRCVCFSTFKTLVLSLLWIATDDKAAVGISTSGRSTSSLNYVGEVTENRATAKRWRPVADSSCLFTVMRPFGHHNACRVKLVSFSAFELLESGMHLSQSINQTMNKYWWNLKHVTLLATEFYKHSVLK